MQRTLLVNYDNLMFVYVFSYKSDMHNVSTHTVAGSTLPLVRLNKDEESNSYNPFEHRKVANPTT